MASFCLPLLTSAFIDLPWYYLPIPVHVYFLLWLILLTLITFTYFVYSYLLCFFCSLSLSLPFWFALAYVCLPCPFLLLFLPFFTFFTSAYLYLLLHLFHIRLGWLSLTKFAYLGCLFPLPFLTCLFCSQISIHVCSLLTPTCLRLNVLNFA